MDIKPVFRDKSELGIWKKLETGSWRNNEQFIDWLDVILRHDGAMDSNILVKAIETVNNRKCLNSAGLIKELVSKRRSIDSMPLLAAAKIFLEAGDINSAKEMESKVKTGNIPSISCVRARIAMAEGDNQRAKKELMRARCSDSTYSQFYDLIEKVDPTGGWMFRRNIELLASGKETVTCGSRSDSKDVAERLYDIYNEWYSERRDDATRELISSEEYRNKNPEFLLASARMSMDENDWHSAQMVYEMILATKPNCMYILCEAAESYFREENYERALSLYRDAEALDPCSERVINGLIETYYACGMLDEAIQCISGYLDMEGVNIDIYARCANFLYGWGRYNESSNVISRVLAIYPEDTGSLILSSKIQVGKGNYSIALDISSDTLHRNPGNKACRLQYASVLLSLGKIERAQKEIEKVLKSEPKNIEALLLMVNVFNIRKDNENAILTCKKILEIDTTNSEALGILAKNVILTGKGQIDTVDSSEIKKDFNPKNMIELAGSLIVQSRFKEAIDLCNEYEKRFGSNLKIKRIRGNAEYALGEYLKASASYASAAAMDPTDPIIWHSKGMADEKSGDLDSAEEAFNKAVLLDLNEPEFWISCSCVQQKKGNMVSAVESLNRAIELSPNSSYALVKKGMIFATMKRYEEALYFLKLADMTDENEKEILKVERDIYLAASMHDKMINISERIIRLDPKDQRTVEILAKEYLSKGEKDLALSTINNALIRNQDSISLLLEKKELLTQTGDFLGIIKVCEKILEIQPDNRMVRTDLADLYLRVGDSRSSTILQDLDQKKVIEKEIVKETPKKPIDIKESTNDIDPESSYQIACSLLKTGDIQGSIRMIERALSSDQSNSKYILFRAQIYEASGDQKGADAFLSGIIDKGGKVSDICEADGDIKYRMGDLKGASSRYSASISNGKSTSGIYMKLGFMQEKSGDYVSAIDNFKSSVMKDPKNCDAYRHLAACYMLVNKVDDAESTIESLYAFDRSAMTIALRAKVFSEKKDVKEVQSMYEQYLRCTDKVTQSQEIMVKAMESVGLKQDANNVSQAVKNKESSSRPNASKNVPDKVKRNSERVLRRAYTSGSSLRDQDLLESLDIDKDMADAIFRYLSDMSEYGDIVPGTPEFDRMEQLSMNAIIKGDCTGIEEDPIISIPCAFVAGGSKDSDEAKLLVAYIYKVMKIKTDKRVLEDVKASTAIVSKSMPVEEIVKSMHVGIYHAKTVKEYC
jgi:tetratricopeptide (TPR) repeat protein